VTDGVSGTDDTFECWVCHGTFTKTRSDEEAMAEMKATWQPTSGDDDPGTVCDDCFTKVMAWAHTSAPEVLRRKP
jgi:hypothetical protein